MLNFFNKIKNYFIYLEWIFKKRSYLDQQFRLRIDNIGRIYTVINMPDDVLKYGTDLSINKVQLFVRQVGSYFKQENIYEFIMVRNVKRIDEINYLIVFGFSQIDQLKLVQTIITVLSSITLGILLYIYELPGLYFPLVMLSSMLLIFFNKKIKQN